VRDLPGNTAELAVVPGSSVPAWVIVTAAAAVVLAGGTVLIRRRKKAPVKQAEE
jgi:LPXTG-motif cell wall anchor domain protein